MDRDAPHFEVPSVRYCEAFPFEKSFSELARFHVKALDTLVAREPLQRFEEGQGDASSRRLGATVEMINVSVSFQVAVAQQTASIIHGDKGGAAVASSCLDRRGVDWSRRPGHDLFG
ncbi:hypothetical protein LJR164_004514 [Phenylobacterium sp. LjRoot164]